MKRISLAVSLVALVILMASTECRAQWTLYDNFSAARISQDKWLGYEEATGHMEVVRRIESGKLHLFNRTYGADTGSNKGVLGLSFTNPDAIKGMRARVRIRSYEAEGCTAGTAAASTRFRLHGSFFNTGSALEGDRTNDVQAYIGIRRNSNFSDPANTLRVVASIWRCLNPSCATDADLESIDYRELGTIETQTWATLGIEWDPAKDRFLFLLGSKKVAVSYADYLQDHMLKDEEFPGYKGKSLHTTETCPNCSESMGSMDGDIDYVHVKY